MSDLSEYPLLSQSENILGGKTVIDGTRIAVYNIWAQTPQQSNIPVSEINEKYPHLSRKQIRQAIDYAENHKGEMKRIAHNREQISRIFRYRTVICTCEDEFDSINQFLEHAKMDKTEYHKVDEHVLKQDIYCTTCKQSFSSILDAIEHISETEWHEIEEPSN